jgi:hypothetical protein
MVADWMMRIISIVLYRLSIVYRPTWNIPQPQLPQHQVKLPQFMLVVRSASALALLCSLVLGGGRDIDHSVEVGGEVSFGVRRTSL